MRFQATCFRAHDPRWSFKPISGDGAALRGARFNPRGLPALYLAMSLETAIKEANQGFARKIDPCVLCSYEVDCTDIIDLRTDADRAAHGIALSDMSCAWLSILNSGGTPPSWTIATGLIANGAAGVIVPSFAPGATADDQNLVLWDWSEVLPHKVAVHDPSGRLPKNALSWD